MQIVLLPIINDGFSSSEDQAPTPISDIRLMEVSIDCRDTNIKGITTTNQVKG